MQTKFVSPIRQITNLLFRGCLSQVNSASMDTLRNVHTDVEYINMQQGQLQLMLASIYEMVTGPESKDDKEMIDEFIPVYLEMVTVIADDCANRSETIVHHVEDVIGIVREFEDVLIISKGSHQNKIDLKLKRITEKKREEKLWQDKIEAQNFEMGYLHTGGLDAFFPLAGFKGRRVTEAILHYDKGCLKTPCEVI
jgi:hypothetical protein